MGEKKKKKFSSLYMVCQCVLCPFPILYFVKSFEEITYQVYRSLLTGIRSYIGKELCERSKEIGLFRMKAKKKLLCGIIKDEYIIESCVVFCASFMFRRFITNIFTYTGRIQHTIRYWLYCYHIYWQLHCRSPFIFRGQK